MTPKSSYQAREGALLRRLAMATLTDPKASPEDRLEARDRLRDGVADVYDYSRLDNAELETFRALLRKLVGR